jgi:hypothetical protein
MRALLKPGVWLVVAACSGVPAQVEPPDSGDPHGLDGGIPLTGCMHDSDCGDGQVCVDCDGDGQCTPGCREDSQCPARNICQLGTVCQTCPCPPGWCILNPCRDEDSDGFAASDDPTVTCAIPKGDCNDRDPTIHPGAPELCSDYVDNNCDGVLDERDPACQCPNSEQRCGNTFDCGAPGSIGCTKGCCVACQQPYMPDCSSSGECAVPYGANQNDACIYGYYCTSCSCSGTQAPVCGNNGVTYNNACVLGISGAEQLHDGACLPGEGIACKGQLGLDGGCGPSGQMYCRDLCAPGVTCSLSTCTKNGACVLDSDCPAGLPPAECDAGTATYTCSNGACVSNCR